MAGTEPVRQLSSPTAAELLLKELYVDLRRHVRLWSAVTRQTPQARMGYVGQHLVSVVTGFPGGRSGARGHDLVLPGGEFAEIKTCYRVDQLGLCSDCLAAVSSIEDECPDCGSANLVRKDDSKWLISIRNDEEMRTLFDPTSYYLVLFDFEGHRADSTSDVRVDVISGTPNINARLWQIDPENPGFHLCMIDYYVNIRANSQSRAPFNLWPFSLKFQLMRPKLIYHAVIRSDDSISTSIFPSLIGTESYYPIDPFPGMAGFRSNLSDHMLHDFSKRQNVPQAPNARRIELLRNLEKARSERRWTDEWLAPRLADIMYRDKVADHPEWLPRPR